MFGIKLIVDGILISIIWFLAIFTIKQKNYQKIALRKKNDKVKNILDIIAKCIIIILLIIDFILLINNNFQQNILALLDLPVISHIIILSSYYIIIKSANKIFLNLNNENINTTDKYCYAFSFSLIILSLSLLIFYFQSIFWGRFSYIYSTLEKTDLFYEAIIDSILILIPSIIIIINSVRFIKNSKINKRVIKISFCITLFISVTQTILVKALVIYELYYYIKEKILSKLNKNIKVKENIDDPLLISSAINKENIYSKINFYYLISYFIPILFLWLINVNPLPSFRTLYSNGNSISLFFILSIILFWIIENIVSKLDKKWHFLSIIFIPIMILFTIYPFYTGLSNISTNLKETEIYSLYHIIANSLGSKKYLFFICINVLQGSIAYIIGIITCEEKCLECNSVIPIIFITQLALLCILYPLIVVCPPYFLHYNNDLIGSGLFILGTVLTILIGIISFKIFTKSKWSVYVKDYWKNQSRLFIIIGIITFIIFYPIYLHALYSIENSNIINVWEKKYFNDFFYTATNILKTTDDSKGVLVLDGGGGNTKLISFNADDGTVLWEKEYYSKFKDFKYFPNNEVVLIKDKNKGFSIINLNTGNSVYDYSIQNSKSLEYFSIDVNNQSILITEDTKQILFDHTHGEIPLDIIGNNFYELVPGNQTAIMKDNIVYIFEDEQWIPIKDLNKTEDLEYLYYDEDGFILFTSDKVIKYDYFIKNKEIYIENKSEIKLFSINNKYYNKINDEIIFYINDDNKYYAYILNVKENTYRIIPLEQKIKGFRDLQDIWLMDDENKYMLYDEYQFSVYKDENLFARQWYDLPHDNDDRVNESLYKICNPIIIGDSIIWSEQKGSTYSVKIKN